MLQGLAVSPKTGQEEFRRQGTSAGFRLTDFWRWSVSDLVSNVTRGRLAEFLVAKALGISTDGVRDEWAPYDLVTPDGVKIEVKSAAYVQSWFQRKLSPIQFAVRPTRGWDPATNRTDPEVRRQADVYVFALLAQRDKAAIDPLDLDQWRFYVLATAKLNAEWSGRTISLAGLERLAGAPCEFERLREALAGCMTSAHRTGRGKGV
jgi:hypothetical protein